MIRTEPSVANLSRSVMPCGKTDPAGGNACPIQVTLKNQVIFLSRVYQSLIIFVLNKQKLRKSKRIQIIVKPERNCETYI